MNEFPSVEDLVKEHNLEVLHAPCELSKMLITDKSIDRIGMQLMGFFFIHHPERFHMMGMMEAAYIETLEPAPRREAIKTFFEAGTSGIVITHNASCDPIILEMAKQYNKLVARTSASPSEYIHDFYYFTSDFFAPYTILSGGFVSVHGEGILILGKSGIGKSETAIQLIKRGHRMIADDSVLIKRMPYKYLAGYSPSITEGFVELRGLGIVNVKAIYGAQALQSEEHVSSAVHFVPWEQGENYDRLGESVETMEILGLNIPIVKVPVRPGRDLAAIVEVHALNQRAKRNGYSAVDEIDARQSAEGGNE